MQTVSPSRRLARLGFGYARLLQKDKSTMARHVEAAQIVRQTSKSAQGCLFIEASVHVSCTAFTCVENAKGTSR